MKAYSMDLRERMLQAVDKGYACNEVIELFGISRATIKRYLKQRRETGEVNVRPIPGRPSKKYAPLQAGLTDQLRRYSDATLEFHCQLWEQEHGKPGEYDDDGTCDQANGLDAKKKTSSCHRTQRRGTSSLMLVNLS